MDIFITKEYIMKKIIRLTESDLARIVKRVIKENELNMVNETSIMSRIQYNKQIRDAKNQAKENDECMCVVETIVSGVIVKPCDDLTPTEEEHIIFYTKNCGDSFEDDDEM